MNTQNKKNQTRFHYHSKQLKPTIPNKTVGHERQELNEKT